MCLFILYTFSLLVAVLHADSVDAEARIMTHLDVALPVSSALDYGALSVGSPVIQSFPAGTPVWATRLRDCQVSTRLTVVAKRFKYMESSTLSG